MKQSFLLILSLALFAGCNSLTLQSPDFTLELVYFEQESSEDSNGTETIVSIIDNKVTCNWSYWGYHPSEDFERNKVQTLTLDDAELTELKALLVAENLWTEVNEEKESNGDGDSLTVTLFVSEEDQTVSSKVKGMEWLLETKAGNIENLEFLNSVSRVLYFIETRLDD